MEIMISAEIHPFDLQESEGAMVIPLAPPLPAFLLCKQPYDIWQQHIGYVVASFKQQHIRYVVASFKQQLSTAREEDEDSDSGHGDSVMHDILPGLELSDWEFNEEFSSATSSRRPSAGTIPLPPPPPPLPGYVSKYLRTSDPGILTIPDEPLDGEPRLLSQYEQDMLELTYLQFEDYFEDDHHSACDDDIATVERTCIVCYIETLDHATKSTERKCCKEFVCQECISAIVHTNINEGQTFISCPNVACNGAIGKTEILSHIVGTTKEKFERLRAEAEVEGSNTKRACPNCSYLTEHQLPKRFRRYREEDVQITCQKCQFAWCFACHAPWHKDVSCKEFKKGNMHFKKWTNERSTRGVANCQKCPLCRVYIQRSTGCDHMTCNRCDTHFCYKCGGRFIDIIGIGSHYDETSVLGCKHNYCRDQPIKRKTVRGSYLGSKLAALTGYPVLFVAGVAVVVVVGAVALPIYGGYRYYKYRKNMKTRYWNRKRN